MRSFDPSDTPDAPASFAANKSVHKPTLIYLDNASTTYPKPPCVAEAVAHYISECGTNIGRGSYAQELAAEDMVFDTREQLARLFGVADPSCVVFSSGVTESLNVVLKGYLHPGDHVLVSAMEHNAVMRPLQQLAATRGITFTRVPCTQEGALRADELEGCLTPATRAVVMLHASNVCGTVMPIAQVGEFAQRHGLLFVVDSAQSAGVLPLDMASAHIGALCFTGHKGLLGPQGIGGICFAPEVAQQVAPLVAGGTGSASDSEVMPSYLPDKFEAGTQNLPGIAGLHAALAWLEEKQSSHQAIKAPSGQPFLAGASPIYAHELALTNQFLEGLRPLVAAEKICVFGYSGAMPAGVRTGVVSIGTACADEAVVAQRLADEFGIATRVGLHCAPSAHKTLGSFPTGTIRFSFGWANTADDVARALEALENLSR